MNFYFLFLSLVLGLAAAITAFITFAPAIKRLYISLIPAAKKKELDQKVNTWWEESISKRPISLFRLSLESILHSFLTNGKIDIIKVLFFSYSFTLISLGVGYFFSNIGNYLSIYWQFPVDFINGLELQNIDGTLVTDSMAIAKYREDALIAKKAELFGNVVFFLCSLLNIRLCYKIWKQNQDPNVVFSFTIISTLLILIAKPLTVLADVIAGRYEVPGDYLFLLVFNALFLIIPYSQIIKIRKPQTAIKWFFAILLGNFLVWTQLAYNRFDYIIFTNFIDGVCNRFVAMFAISFLFDYMTFKWIWRLSSLLSKKHARFLFGYLLLVVCVTLVTAMLTFLVYNFYIFEIQSSIPEFSMNPGYVKRISYFDFLKASAFIDFVGGEYAFFFYALSTFTPVVIFLSYGLILLMIRIFAKHTSRLVFYIYIVSNSSNAFIVPLYLILMFVSFLICVATTHMSYISFAGYHAK